jgi:hypothetical protein
MRPITDDEKKSIFSLSPVRLSRIADRISKADIFCYVNSFFSQLTMVGEVSGV